MPKTITLTDREIDVILRGLTFALDFSDTYFAFHPDEDYNDGDLEQDQDAQTVAQGLRERLGGN